MDVPNKRAKTCGYCGKKLDSFFYRDLSRTRGYFCSAEHCTSFIANGNKGIVPGLKEDEVESVGDLKQQGHATYEDRG